MTTRRTPTATLGRTLRTGLLAAAVTALVGGAATAPAFAAGWDRGNSHADGWDRGNSHADGWDRGNGYADGWDRGGSPERRDGWREHEHFVHRHYVRVAPSYRYDYVAPGYGYAPAPLYPAPLLRFGFDFR